MIGLYNDDCLKIMAAIPSASIDAVICDPPYELGFMGKSWDSTGIANSVEVWKQALRVLKPGGYLLAFSGTRTYHRMASAIEDAGFEIRDMIEWVYGSGFPKSRNIGKDIDRIQGNDREITGCIKAPGYAKKEVEMGKQSRNIYDFVSTKGTSEWEGWGTALKPAHEPICMARKPLAEKTVAENCLKWGTGGINIDESRVDVADSEKEHFEKEWDREQSLSAELGGVAMNKGLKAISLRDNVPSGRFPANLIHDNSEEVRECFPNESERFFKSIIYAAKASKSDRGEGNSHPTVKPVALMEYLINMITKPEWIVLDPFMGSGTTGVAAVNLNRHFVGIELDKGYFDIAQTRIKAAEALLA